MASTLGEVLAGGMLRASWVAGTVVDWKGLGTQCLSLAESSPGLWLVLPTRPVVHCASRVVWRSCQPLFVDEKWVSTALGHWLERQLWSWALVSCQALSHAVVASKEPPGWCYPPLGPPCRRGLSVSVAGTGTPIPCVLVFSRKC